MLARVVTVSDLNTALAGDVARRLRAATGPFQLALDGGPAVMGALEAMAGVPAPWSRATIWQVSEAIVAEAHPARVWPSLWGQFAVPANFNGIPVDPVGDPVGGRAAQRYSASLTAPPCRGVLDCVVLELAADGGIGALRPGSPALREHGDVAVIGGQNGSPGQVTLTLPAFAKARAIVLVAPGADRREAVRRLLAGDAGVPAGRLRHPQFMVFVEP